MPSKPTPQPARMQPKRTAQPLPKLEVHAAQIPNFDDLPDSAWVRQSQLVRDPKHPTRPTPLPFSPATFWRLVASHKFPKPTKLSERVTAWRVGEVRAWLNARERCSMTNHTTSAYIHPDSQEITFNDGLLMLAEEAGGQ